MSSIKDEDEKSTSSEGTRYTPGESNTNVPKNHFFVIASSAALSLHRPAMELTPP